MDSAHPTIGTHREEERQELQAVLQSGILDHAPNLRHFLEYVAEQYFAGKADEVKEYSIAVQALHRLEKFDPQSDTIVRVAAHALRKKLEQYYATEGADHQIQIRLPAGKYLLQFAHIEQVSMPPANLVHSVSSVEEPAHTVSHESSEKRFIWAGLAVAGVTVLMLLGINLLGHRQPGMPLRPERLEPTAGPGGGPGPAEPEGMAQDRAIRIRFGPASHSYVDVAGQTWRTDQYCKGGSTFSHPNHTIQGTDDPALFQEGREGKFQCRIPVPSGIYQLELLFADTAGDKEAARQVDISINDAVTASLDIVDEAGGNDVVVGKVYPGIHPMNDGAIHLNFTSDGSFVNAVELTLSESDAGLPLRMLAGPAVFHDDQGNTWIPERFFQGGRRTFHPDNLPKVANARLLQWQRYGHFHYLIPVVAGKVYRVRLYFSEEWFGSSNGGPGGVGSRVFDVYCNGTTLLKDFDISRNQKSGMAMMTFNRVKPTAHGMLELYFTPVKNYPLINAIEVEPEG
jgi:malectin (di-glucose binding ER protein)